MHSSRSLLSVLVLVALVVFPLAARAQDSATPAAGPLSSGLTVVANGLDSPAALPGVRTGRSTWPSRGVVGTISFPR
jgi:hypothetical protein